MFNIFKRNKITLYFVFKNTNDTMPMTILNKLSDIDEYISRRILVDNYTHFKSWCELHDHDPEDKSVMQEYIQSILSGLTPDDLKQYDFVVKTAVYDPNRLSSLLRMFYSCVPLGCSWEQPSEVIYTNILYNNLKNTKGKQEDEQTTK